MSTAAERLNSAILALEWNAPAEPAGIREAIKDLAVHWVNYWNSAQRRNAPPITQAPKLSRYAAWYARGWALLPEAVRAQLVHPSEIDATAWAGVEDQLTYMIEANAAAAEAAGEAAAVLAKEVHAASATALKGLLVIAGAAACVLLAYGYARR